MNIPILEAVDFWPECRAKDPDDFCKCKPCVRRIRAEPAEKIRERFGDDVAELFLKGGEIPGLKEDLGDGWRMYSWVEWHPGWPKE